MKYNPNKTDKARTIIAALYNLTELPDMELYDINTIRVKKLSRKPLNELNGLYQMALKIINDR